MKRLVFLKTEYLEVPKKMSKAKEQEVRTALYRKSICQFKKDMNDWLQDKSIQITKEYDQSEAAVVIEFDQKIWDTLYSKLIAVDIVEIIDIISE